ncbi:hypothetical protein CsSME_00017236 [Camellia sinensis var. sinensis]
MTVNITSIKTSSNGIWQGDNPLNYAFPLLIVQTTLILLVSRILAFLLKPLRQPKGGIVLGPSAIGRNQHYRRRIFPTWSTPILESVASIGLLFFLFLVGLELDLTSIRRSGRRAFAIAAAGITLPFTCGIGVAFVLRKSVKGADKVGYVQYLVFMGVALSITAFPVLARILAELKLLTTRSPLVSVYVLLSGVAFVAFMMVVIRPAMRWVARRCSPEHEAYITLTLAGVMVSGFVTDFIGIHSIFGAFVFGLTIPKGEFAERLIERIEDFVSGLLLPLYFASSGLKTDVAKIRGGQAWGLLALVITTACSGKIIGTFAVAMMCMIPAREAITLGVLMNTKGLVELIVLNIGKEKKVLNDEVFAIMVLMALFTTFITTPTVMAIFKPARPGQLHSANFNNIKDELRVLACVHGPGNIPSLINVIESTRSTIKSRLKLYIMHLVELTERSSSIVMVQRARKNGFPFINRQGGCELHDRVAVAFQAYGQLGRVSIRPTTAISPLSSMHEDICHMAEDKRVTMIILPFHKQWRRREDGGDEEEVENVGHGWRGVNQKVLKNAPCSVAVLVDRGFNVCIVFFGGPDDREALELGGRMAEHPSVKVTVVRFIEKDGFEANGVILRPSLDKSREKSYTFSTAIMNREKEKELDEGAVVEFRNKWDGVAEYTEVSSNIVSGVMEIGQSGDYDLMVVGKGRFPSSMVAELADREAEHAELGPIGDMLACPGQGIVSSVLVIQQHDLAHTEEAPVSKIMDLEDGPVTTSHGPSSPVGTQTDCV